MFTQLFLLGRIYNSPIAISVIVNQLSDLFDLNKCLGTGRDCLLAYQVGETAFGETVFGETAFGDVLFSLLPSESQVIITSYEFQCCCNITGWKTYIKPKNEGLYIITFQVWRPLQMNGCYELVGANRFVNIESGIINKTPDPSDVIAAQPGDVVGFYNSFGPIRHFGIQLDRTHNASVWYYTSSITDQNIRGEPECPLSMASISSTNAGPIVTAIVSK